MPESTEDAEDELTLELLETELAMLEEELDALEATLDELLTAEELEPPPLAGHSAEGDPLVDSQPE